MLELKDIVVSFKKEVQKKIFGTERKTVLHGISLAAQKGESLGILGESGSGKSTTGRVLAGLLKPDSGAVLIEGEDVYAGSKGREHLRNRLSIVFQDYTTSANPRFTIRQVIGEGIAVGARKTGEQVEYAEETRKTGERSTMPRRRHGFSGSSDWMRALQSGSRTSSRVGSCSASALRGRLPAAAS